MAKGRSGIPKRPCLYMIIIHQNGRIVKQNLLSNAGIDKPIALWYNLSIATALSKISAVFCFQELIFMELEYTWTDGGNPAFAHFYRITEDYYSALVGGEKNRKGFVPYNLSESVETVLIVSDQDKPVACAGLKRYSQTDAEIKRVWVEPEYRRRHIAVKMMQMLEKQALQQGYLRTVLQTRAIMTDAVRLYTGLGYHQIENYPPYDKLDGAVCFAKELK